MKRRLPEPLRARLLAGLLAAALGGCGGLPSLEGRTASAAFVDTADTALGRAIAPRAAAHPGRSGVYALPGARDAFAARVLLARAAERSLDVQYYIWNDDHSGRLLMAELRAAAERGVRVRLLLDDNNTAGLDAKLAGLDAHENIEVRLFNPFVQRRARWLGYLVDFARLNRRMHNKSFTADSQATIVGGRNVGDEYFDATEEGVVFMDLDVLAVGPVVAEVSADFDRYWASGSSYPASRILKDGSRKPAEDEPQAGRRGEGKGEEKGGDVKGGEAVESAPFARELLAGRLAFEWTTVRLVSDDPAKGLGRAEESALLPHRLVQLLGEPRDTVELVSGYFAPAETGTAHFTRMASNGVNARILTNSFEATDVAVVHAGYAKRRRALLEAGVELYELRRLPRSAGQPEWQPPARRKSRLAGSSGSSASSLHAKTFAVDGERVFIGSYNFDPRSADLNTEMGLLIDSPGLARRIDAVFAEWVPAMAYQPRIADDGALHWIERRDGKLVRHDTEPGTSVASRMAIRILSWLPIEWLL